MVIPLPIDAEVATWTLVLAGLAAVTAGGLQSTLGFGASFVLVPALALVAPELLPGAIIVAIVPLSVVMLLTRRVPVDLRAVGRVTLGRLPGIALGGVVVAVLSPRSLTVAIALLLLAAVVTAGFGWEVEVTRTNELLAGVASGVTGTAAALGGPPLALLFRGSAGEVLRSTLAGVWLVGSLPVLASLYLAGSLTVHQLWVGALLGVGLVTGLALARPLVARLSEETLRRAVLWWAGGGALAALGRALLVG
jgi:uncharacterized protein